MALSEEHCKISRLKEHIFERQGKYAIRVFVLCAC